MKAIWNGAVIAESEETIVVEGNHYFPPNSIYPDYFRESDNRTQCPWKGTAYYFDVDVNGEKNEDAAWYYPDPKDKAKNIKNYVAFWNGVEVIE